MDIKYWRTGEKKPKTSPPKPVHSPERRIPLSGTAHYCRDSRVTRDGMGSSSITHQLEVVTPFPHAKWEQ